MLVFFIGIVCVRSPVCVCVCTRACVQSCGCVYFTMLCMKMFINCIFVYFYAIVSIDIYMGVSALHVFL